MLATVKVENEKLIEIAVINKKKTLKNLNLRTYIAKINMRYLFQHQLEKKKTRSVCVREDIAPIKRDLQECMTKNMELINKFNKKKN